MDKKKNLFISLAKIALFAGYIHDNNISQRFPKTTVILSSQLLNTIAVYKNHENASLVGVKSKGLGALNIYPDDFRLIPLQKEALENLFEKTFEGFLHREIKSIFEELGLPIFTLRVVSKF